MSASRDGQSRTSRRELVHWLHEVWAPCAPYLFPLAFPFGAYKVWRKLPRWKAEWGAATTSDESALTRAIKAIEAMEPRWRWPWQRG